ncbi:M20/M25/M40 family metallo-hydrolase [Nucisporomicrobium flavum]|uniref:M20/M25/M40 family metallo-hydrolase n=1 Tax=Nucisporomicrobium flavum TaxID=2785915 RepID=UPI0018F48336|nr:M20/M25/M40 family metallo-hydrolase [Nucisporomicrobium flavum]
MSPALPAAGFVRDLRAFAAVPSVSGEPGHAADIRAAARWLAARLRRAGLEYVRLLATPCHPVVVGSWRHARGRPTVLLYGHYDVQPAGPGTVWRSPPFVPTLRGDRLYGRGTSDDKGQLLTHVAAIEDLLRRHGRLPVNVVCLYEGEEEIGSPSLPGVLERYRAEFAADVAVASDTRMRGPGRPALTYSLRGSVALELRIRGPAHDLHAGAYGGAVHNPAQVLCDLIASLHDDDGRVRVPGFYRGVRRPDPAERARMRRSGPDDRTLLRDAGVRRGWGVPGTTLYERTTVWPALTVNGLTAGHQGPGSKSIIPAYATARIGMRLGAGQDPAWTAAAVARHLARRTPPTVRCELRLVHAASPVQLDRRSEAVTAGVAAYRCGFGVPPLLLRSGGTIPAVSLLRDKLGIGTALLGFALPGDRAHGPDESAHLPTLGRGVVTIAAFLTRMGNLLPERGAVRIDASAVSSDPLLSTVRFPTVMRR